MAVAQQMSEQEYQTFVRSNPAGLWELHDGRLVEKPGMSWKQLDVSFELGHQLRLRLDGAQFRVFVDAGCAGRSPRCSSRT